MSKQEKAAEIIREAVDAKVIDIGLSVRSCVAINSLLR
jgi:hypothetical protein